MVKTLLRNERGAHLVELALMLPFLSLLVLGVLDIGRGFSSYIALTNAAREGARWITINPDDTNGAFGRIYGEAGRVGLDNSDIIIDLQPYKTRYSAGDEVTVNIQYDHQLLFGALNTSSIPFKVRVTMVVLFD